MLAVYRYECACIYMLVCPEMIEETGWFRKLILSLSGQESPMQKVEVCG